ncbi:MAG: hypothetical protein V2A53_02145 [bacterium]
MLKRLSMVLAATAVMGICMAMVPQKVEGANVTHRVRYSDNYTRGLTSIKRQTKPYDYAGRVFTTGSSGYYIVNLGRISSGSAKSYAKVGRYSDTKSWSVPWYNYILDLNCTGY